MKIPRMRKRDSGSVLLEALFSSVLVVFAVYAATNAKITLSTLSSSTDSRGKLTQAVREYSYLIYQYGSDLDVARNKDFNQWTMAVKNYCTAMVRASKSAKIDLLEPPTTSSSFIALWQYNFLKAVPFMNFKLDSCIVSQSSELSGEQILVELVYSWNDFDGKNLSTSSTRNNTTPAVVGVRKETTRLNIAKP